MRIIIICIMLMAPAVIAQAQQVVNDPYVEVRQIQPFTSVTVASGIELHISKGEAEAVAVSAADPEIKNDMETRVENGVLTISFNWKKHFFKTFSKRNIRMKAYVTCKTLDKLTVKGAASVITGGDGIEQNSLVLHVSGAGYFRGRLNVQHLDMTLSGASNAQISGAAAKAVISVSGASNLAAYGLTAEEGNVNVSGSSHASVTVAKTLQANAKGSSGIHYKGNCTVAEQARGSSDIRKTD